MRGSWLIPVIFILLKLSSLIQSCSVRGRNGYLSVYSVKQGKRFALETDFKTKNGTYVWRKVGKPLTVKNCIKDKESECTERIYTFKDNPSLVFQRTALEDSGKYILEFLYGRPLRRVYSFRLIVEAKPSVYTDCTNMTAYEGDSISCVCQADNLNATVSWNQTKPKSKNPGINYFNDILILENVSTYQSGKYTCSAQKRDIVNTTSFYLNVLPKNSAMTFTKVKIRYFRAFQETGGNCSRLVLLCNAEGNPQPSYTILHQGTAVKSRNMYTVHVSEQSSHGHYECLARNSLGFDRRLLFLNASLTCIEKQPKFFNKSKTVEGKETEEKESDELGWEEMLIVAVCSFFAGILLVCTLILIRKKFNKKQKKSECVDDCQAPSSNSELRCVSDNPGKKERRQNAEEYDLPFAGKSTENVGCKESNYQELSENRETDEGRYESLKPIQS